MERRFNFEGPRIEGFGVVAIIFIPETLKDIAESGKGQFIVVPDTGQYILNIP